MNPVDNNNRSGVRDYFGNCHTDHGSNNKELTHLVPKENLRPRSSTIFFMVNSSLGGGVVSRANYMSRCFLSAWQYNLSDVPKLMMMLWDNESSIQQTYRTIMILIIQWVIPFIPLLLLFVSPLKKNTPSFKGFTWLFLVVEFLCALWHLSVLYILKRNLKLWKDAWFTFQVPAGTIGVVETDSTDLSVFHYAANIRFVTVTLDNLSKLETVSKHEQNLLEADMRRRHMEDVEIILYTEDFIDLYNSWPKNMEIALMAATVSSLVIVFYFMVRSY